MNIINSFSNFKFSIWEQSFEDKFENCKNKKFMGKRRKRERKEKIFTSDEYEEGNNDSNVRFIPFPAFLNKEELQK